MKRFLRPTAIILASLLIALFSAAVTYTAKTYGSGYSTTAAYFLQTTPTPPAEEDRSEVGSTDGIVVMGGVIALIVLIPILVKRKSWLPTEQG
jgi:glucan phosphoethanolaminetransferase (alkaline phosphatase superfamily)